MASKDFLELMTKLYQEKYVIFSINENYNALDIPPSFKVTVVLEKDGERISIQSSEWDFIQFTLGLRGIVDTKGDYNFKKLKDADKYTTDTLHLIDEDKSKISKAAEEILSKKFVFTYSPEDLIEEFLENDNNIKNLKFLPLKNDYYHMLALALIQTRKMLKYREEIVKKFPDTKKVIDVIETTSLKSFRPTGNGIKDFNFYKKYMKFDINSLGERMRGEIIVTNDTLLEFKNRGELDANVAIPKMMTIYSHLLEIITPMINFIRIGLELKRDNPSPEATYGVGKNIRILKSDREYSSLFQCLDDQIRNSDAHSSRRIDKEKRQVLLIDARSGVEKVKRIYSFDELIDLINTMQNEFFPAIYPTIVLIDMTMLDILLTSREYKFILLGLGNC